MEKKIREYEKFIEAEMSKEMSTAKREELAELNREMINNFQYERIVHLIVTLFFVVLTMIFLFATAWGIVAYGFSFAMIPLYLLTAILIILTCFYIKHYYFLENHIQGLYKYIKKLKMVK